LTPVIPPVDFVESTPVPLAFGLESTKTSSSSIVSKPGDKDLVKERIRNFLCDDDDIVDVPVELDVPTLSVSFLVAPLPVVFTSVVFFSSLRACFADKLNKNNNTNKNVAE
jgi:hypothetical protein